MSEGAMIGTVDPAHLHPLDLRHCAQSGQPHAVLLCTSPAAVPRAHDPVYDVRSCWTVCRRCAVILTTDEIDADGDRCFVHTDKQILWEWPKD